MNSVYITVGGTLILALCVALIGPLFIDWSAYRSVFESYGEKILGHQVTILGETDVQLLPAPYVKLSDVRVGAVEDPLLTIQGFEGRIELPSLLRGEVHVTEMKLTAPQLQLSLDESGRLDVLQAQARSSVIAEMDPGSLVLENVQVEGGSIELIDAQSGLTRRADNANLQLSAGGLQGPFKAEGALTYDGVPYTLKIGSGRLERDGKIRVKSQVSPANIAAQFSTDGYLRQQDGVVSYSGEGAVASVVTEGSEALEWAAKGTFDLNGERLELTDSTLRLGSEDRPITAEGGGAFTFGPDAEFAAVATFKQVDLDRLIGGGPQKPLVPADVVMSQMLKQVNGLPHLTVPGSLDLQVPVVVAGGSVVSNVQVQVESVGTGWRIAEFAGELPGRSAFNANGYLELANSPVFQGEWSLSSRLPHQLAHWWLGERKDASNRLAAVSLKGRIEAGSGAIRLPDLRIDTDDARSVGLVSLEYPMDQEPFLTVDMDSDRVNLDEIERFVRAFTGRALSPSAFDMSLRLYTDELIASGVTAKSMVVSASLSRDALAIEQLKVRDFAGAYIDLQGRIDDVSTTPQGNLKGKLRASSLMGTAAVLEQYLPNSEFVRRLKRAAPELAPAELEAELSAYAEKGRTDISLNLYGSAGVSDVDFNGTFEGRIDEFASGDVFAEASLGGKDSVRILQQLGFPAVALSTVTSGDVRLSVAGSPRTELGFGFESDLVGLKLTSEGTLWLPKSGKPRWQAQVELASADLTDYGLAFGKIYPLYSGRLSADLQASMNGEGRDFEISQLRGQLASMDLTGALNGSLKEDGTVSGEGALQLSELDMRTLSELVLGANVWAGALDGESVWSSEALGQSLLDGVDLTLDVSSDRVFFNEAFRLDAAKGQVTLKPDEIAVADGSGRFAGGAFSGAFDLQRNEGQATLSGRFRLDDANFEELVWAKENRAFATGRLNMIAEFEGSGRTIAGLVSGLSGGGTFQIADGEIRQINPAAFDLVIQAADAGMDLTEAALLDVFEDQLDAGSIRFESIDGALALASGRVRARNISVANDTTTLFGSAVLDLENWEVSGDVSMKTRDEAQKVAGAEPQVGIVFTGAMSEPTRSLDVGPFLSYLNLRAIEQNVKRIEEEQAKIAEQERVLEELKRQQDEETALKEKELAEAKAKAEQEAAAAATQARTEEERKAAEAREKERLEVEAKAQKEAERARAAVKAREAAAAARTQQAQDELNRLVGEPASDLREVTPQAPRATGSAPTVANDNAEPKGLSVKDFEARMRTILQGETLPSSQDGSSLNIEKPPTPRAKANLPALDDPVTIAPQAREATVPASAVNGLGPVEQSGAPRDLGELSVSEDGTISSGPLPDLSSDADAEPKFIQLPGGRLLQVN